MESLVVRLELSPAAAKIVERVVTEFRDQTSYKLTAIVPEHTKKVLEAQLEDASEAVRELERARANPVAVELDAPDDAPE